MQNSFHAFLAIGITALAVVITVPASAQIIDRNGIAKT